MVLEEGFMILAVATGAVAGYRGFKLSKLLKAEQITRADSTGAKFRGAVVDEQVTEVVEPPITDEMTYNATEGKFVEANGDPADQSTVLNWIADHPTASGFAALPGAIGLGYIADKRQRQR